MRSTSDSLGSRRRERTARNYRSLLRRIIPTVLGDDHSLGLIRLQRQVLESRIQIGRIGKTPWYGRSFNSKLLIFKNHEPWLELAETKLATNLGQYAKAGDLTVYYETFGSGEPLVLLHGGGINAKGNWERFVPTFSKHFKVIAPDIRGHGKTNNPKGELGFRLMADDVAHLIQALGLEKPAVCGYSDGGQICLELGMNHPDIASRLVVIGAHNHMTAEDLAGLKGMGIEGPGRVNFQQVEKADPQLISRVRQFSATDDPEYWKTFVTQISKMWLTRLDYTKEDYRKITVPTLILTGDRDAFVSLDDAVETYRSIPRAELAVMADSDHYFPWSKTELFTKTVIDFLQRQSPSKSHC